LVGAVEFGMLIGVISTEEVLTDKIEMHSVVGFLIAWGCELGRLTLG
jgi:hypothetical protein